MAGRRGEENSPMASVRKAVFPAAGLGTRFLPATKAMPKEMLPLVDRPIIQYGVEEAVAAGVTDIVLVTSHGKTPLEDHFDVAAELEAHLLDKGKLDLAADVRRVASLARFSSVRQGQPLGLGHAVLVARQLVGNEPFGVILPDDVIDAEPPALAQMIEVFERVQGPVILVERVPKQDISKYGVIAHEPMGNGVYRITDLVEKPPMDEAPSDLAIVGRYVLTPDIFEMLEATGQDTAGEIQLTNGLRRLLQRRPLYACEMTGVRHDAGNKLGFLKATAYFALKRPDVAGPFREYLQSLDELARV
jgi:UTP--glucose-1-phosphate uridylyltransferase